jgi:glucan phosphoethanolaminetransferase (alkaline phosphatase superfamily)
MPRMAQLGRSKAVGQLLLIAWVLVVTNFEAPGRAALLVSQGRYGALATTALLWIVALATVFAIVANARATTRIIWASIIAFAGSVAWGFQNAAGIELSVFDILGFWEARHEAGNASATYTSSFIWAGMLFALSVGIFAAPYVSRHLVRLRGTSLLALFPMLPIAMIASIVFLKGGNGHFGMPKQFSQWSLAGLVVAKSVYRPKLNRMSVQWKSEPNKMTDKILFLVDESLRPDYASADPHETDTPHFAAFAKQMVSYGPAVSGAVCSNYSNAIFRYMAARNDISDEVNTNPTIWNFAKASGYRTVYIDAQAHAIENETLMQNFMTPEERKAIDGFYPLNHVTARDADFALLEIVAKEMAKPGKVFIYANKQGVHFPYDQNYDPANARFHPTQTEADVAEVGSNVNSYRNAVQRNVEEFFAAFSVQVPLKDAAVVYTSDHGQFFKPGEATHCKSSDTHAESALVPLFAMHSDPLEQQALRDGAKASSSRATHFQIAPTLLRWMGYRDQDITTRYHESLTSGTTQEPAYTVGDIFGLFSSSVEWVAIDLSKNYLEPEAKSHLLAASKTGQQPQPSP